MRCAALFVLFALFGSAFANEKSRRQIPAVPVSSPPTIDGTISLTEWPEEGRSSGFHDITTGVPFSQQGEFWMAYDKDAIYFASRFQDDPKGLVYEEFRDNVSLQSEDRVVIGLDPYGTLANFSSFGLNPNGATQIEISGGRAVKTEWTGSITSAGRVTAMGWEVEARIPWSILPLPASGVRDMRMNVFWSDRSTQRMYSWSYEGSEMTQTGYWRGVNVPAIMPHQSAKLLPYVYAGVDNDGRGIFTAGLDLKTPLGPQRGLVATINPDFRNIENQVLSLDFSRFERLAGETRPFFQEGSMYRGNGLFASQRISEFDMGINSYGSIDDRTTYGFLSTFDFGKSNATVAKVNHQLSDTEQFDGAVVNWDKTGEKNFGSEWVYSKQAGPWGYSLDSAWTDDQIEGYGHSYGGRTYYYKEGIEAGLSYRERSPGYRPRIGYVPERDMRGVNFYLGKSGPISKGPLMETEFNIGGSYYRRFNGDHYRKGMSASASFTFRNGLDVDLAVDRQDFEGDKDSLNVVSIELPRGNLYRRWEVGYVWGKLAGEEYEQINATLLMRPWRRVQMALTAQFQNHFTNDRQIIATFNWDRSKYDTFSGRIIERQGDINWHLAYRHGGGKGAEYFVILGSPNSRTFQPQLILKAVFPFELRF